MRKLLCSLAIPTLLTISAASQASVYINSNDIDLKNSLSVLSSSGLITVPVQQYPLTWRALLLDIESINQAELSNTEALALEHLRHYLRQAETGPKTYLQVSAGSNAPWVNRFGRSVHEQSKLSIARHFTGDNFAARVQVNHRSKPYENDNDLTFDGSYVAYNFGNISASIDSLPLWWGPSQHSSLLMSNNARPVNKLRLDYTPDYAPIGFSPLHVSGFVGYSKSQFDNDSISRELVGIRAASQVSKGLTIGMGVIHQTEHSSPNQAFESNTMLGLDVKKAWSWHQHQFASYAEVAFDGQLQDGESPAFTLGSEWQVNAKIWGSQPLRHTVVAEYTDTSAESFYQKYNNSSNTPYYQHYQRNLGSSFAPDSKTLSLSYRAFAADGSGWLAQIAYSSVEEGDNQQQALLQRSQPLFGGLMNVSVSYHSGVRTSSDSEVGGRITWQWRF